MLITPWFVVAVQLLSRVWLFAVPWTAACQASLSFNISWSLLKLMSIGSVMSSNHLILCCPLLLLPSIFPSIRIFSSESNLCVRWPKCWSFSFSTSPSNEYSGLNTLIFIFFLDYFFIFYLVDNSTFFFIVISKLSSPNFILKFFWLHSVICLLILLLVWITVLPY